ncbi:family 43 glycosylhydrolase [Butyrivibrio fibrisolvens]|uniref:family 43 glycosylhydrolase n=1 Tax=Butyrivibrio fibrisolvens TaxID=831 RepID=UPI0003F9C4C1|nr:family 43 glycosylhydrolase [Butyrivibrio fibrisolvens]
MNIYSSKSEKGFKEGIEAALSGNLELVKQKTRHGLNLEDTDEHGRSVLHYAVLGGNLEIVRYLVLSCQMDPTYADEWLITPYDLAGEELYLEALGMLPSGGKAVYGGLSVKASQDYIYQKYYFKSKDNNKNSNSDSNEDGNNDNRKDIYTFLKEHLGYDLSDTYRNPVMRSFHADPSIVRVGDDYYMVNSSFIYFPGIPISHSKDLVNWQLIGYAVTDPDWASEHLGRLEGGRGFWAPDISYHDGRFYICATLRNNDDMEYPQTQIVTSSDRPEGPYDTPVIHNISGIDPSLFTDDDGRRYMLLNRGACLMEVSSDGKRILSDPEMIAYGWSGHAPEGPHLIKKDGYYYCFLAEGGTGRGHMITVLRSRNLKGPYENCPYNPIMTQKDPIAPIQCCGHGKPVMTQDGSWYIVYLCERMIDGKWGMLGRETALDKITWTADGWPIVNMCKGPSYIAKLPYDRKDSNYVANDSKIWNDGKHNMTIPDGVWLFARTADKKFVDVRRDSSVMIKGDGRDLCDIGCRSFAVYNQKDLVCRDEIQMISPNGLLDHEEAGMTLYYDENSYIKFGLRKQDGCTKAVITEYRDDRYIYEHIFNIEDISENTFTLITDYTQRTFLLNGRCLYTAKDVIGICSEGLSKGKRFTSAMIGAYVFGNNTHIFIRRSEE